MPEPILPLSSSHTTEKEIQTHNHACVKSQSTPLTYSVRPTRASSSRLLANRLRMASVTRDMHHNKKRMPVAMISPHQTGESGLSHCDSQAGMSINADWWL